MAPVSDELIDRSTAVAAELLAAARAGTSRGGGAASAPAAPGAGQRVGDAARLLPGRPGPAAHQPRTAAAQLAEVTGGDLDAVAGLDRLLLRTAAVAGRIAPRPVVGRRRPVCDGRRAPSSTRPSPAPWAALGSLWQAGPPPNLNLLGEAILG